MNAAERERARRVESFFDHALAIRLLLEIPQARFRFAHHARVGCGCFFQRCVEVRRIDAKV